VYIRVKLTGPCADTTNEGGFDMVHICQEGFRDCVDTRAFYSRAGLLPTSTNAMIALVRSHLAYWHGSVIAERATLSQSRGYSIRAIGPALGNVIFRIVDHYDYRNGVGRV
jgi:hypothetical protein